MRKGIKIIIFVITLSICIISIGLIIFSINIQNYKFNNITKHSNEPKIVDITNLDSNITVEHEHIFKTMYDETKHWNQCTICGEKQKEITHTFTKIWTMGQESCNYTNSYTRVCTCGYSETGHKPCTFTGDIYASSMYWHSPMCSICNTFMLHDYYYNGVLYNTGHGMKYQREDYPGVEWCYKSNGERITCINLGTCAVCGYNYNNVNRHNIFIRNGIVKCLACGKNFGKCSTEITKDSAIPATYNIISNINLTNGATFYDYVGKQDDNQIYQENTQILTKGSKGSSDFILKTTVKFKLGIEGSDNLGLFFWISVNGTTNYVAQEVDGYVFYPDSVKPEITNINVGNISNQWSKSKEITIIGTENYCSVVTLQILDDKENIIYTGSGNVTSGNYSISCTPELEAGAEGRTFKAIVTDRCNNSTRKEFTISKIDAMPPEPTSGTKLEENWAKSKNFTFRATDNGIGNVSIAFNDIKDLQLANFDGNEYSREYEFIGDVYRPKELSVLYKDELGNASMQKITVDKLDNTAPTITNVNIHNNKLNITANDIKEGIGEGSGVSKYKYITSTEKLENTEVSDTAVQVNSTENIIVENISEVKYIYVVAEDVVGNISEVYEVEVPQLVLTSKVNLRSNNGKGGIELDWSDYDLTDKYFVIYRKQENASEWEKIVSLEQKLTGGKYTDILANDKTNPSIPTINIEGNQENNNIEITQESIDTGTKYSYYIECYDSTKNTLLNTSNQT